MISDNMKNTNNYSQCGHKTKNIHLHKMSGTIEKEETMDLYVALYYNLFKSL